MVLRGIATSIVITAIAGILVVIFRERLVAGAQNLGSTLGQIATAPVTSFIGQFSDAFANLPDINVNIPALNIGGGGINILGEDPDPAGSAEQLLETLADPASEEGIFPSASGDTLTQLQGSRVIDIGRGTLGRRSIEDIIAENEGVVGIFDLTSTERVEFLPFTAEGVRFFEQEQPGALQLSGQLFQELRSTEDVLGTFG